MPLSFPASPTLNQVYTSGNNSWYWNGNAWAFNTSITVNSQNIASVQTANFSAINNTIYPVNTLTGNIFANLPASPAAGNQIQFLDYSLNFAANNFTISGNGKTIAGGNSYVLTRNNQNTTLLFIDNTIGWTITSSVNPPLSYSISYLVVAGGGSTSPQAGQTNNAGGGAGGFLTGTTTISSGTMANVTVGSGGTGGANGGNSSVVGTGIVSIVAAGGGGNPSGNAGANGGSGGGGSNGAGGQNGWAGGTGIPGQGNNGGAGAYGSSPYASGGGGGAGAAGGAGTSSGSGAGGNGLTTTLISTAQATSASVGQVSGGSVYFAGGGCGTANNGVYGAAGLGGGGGHAQNGTANTGGGVGADGSSGGSGCVILSVPSIYYSGITTGSPVTVTNGSNTVLIYKSSGSYTA
jgi:hypothetical protein